MLKHKNQRKIAPLNVSTSTINTYDFEKCAILFTEILH